MGSTRLDSDRRRDGDAGDARHEAAWPGTDWASWWGANWSQGVSAWMQAWQQSMAAALDPAPGVTDVPVVPGVGAAPAGSLALSEPLTAALAARRADQLLRHAAAHAPFWAHQLGAALEAGAPWQSLPVVDKRQLMEAFDSTLTDPRVTLARVREHLSRQGHLGQELDGRYAVWSTSGTSGEPAVFLHDHGALGVYAQLLASRMDRRMALSRWWDQAAGGALGPLGMRPRSALVAALDGPYAGVSFWARQCRLQPWLGATARAFSVTWPAARLRQALQDWQPAIIASYPSMLVEIARWQREGKLTLAPLALWSGGERLSAAQRAAIESALGAPVINDYGASECLSIAFECPQGHLHLNDDWVILEPVDAQDRPVPPGVASHSVLLTNLANRIQPLIRYRLGDSVRFEPGRCACGSSRPAFTVDGRCDDSLWLRQAGGASAHLSPMALTTVVEQATGVHRFQLIQTAPDALSLRLDVAHVPHPQATREAACQALQRYLHGQGLDAITLSLDRDAPQTDARSGKLRQVVALREAAG